MSSKLNIVIIRKIAKDIAPQYTLLSNTYSTNATPLLWLCPNNHEFPKSWANFTARNQRCRFCTRHPNDPELADKAYLKNKILGSPSSSVNTIDSIKRKAKILEPTIQLLSRTYINNRIPLQWQCSQKHTFKKSWDDFKNRINRCSYCSDTKYNIDIIKDKISNINTNISVRSNEYLGCNKKLKLQCQCGYKFSRSWDNFKARPWCNKCLGKLSYYEYICRKIFETIFKVEFPTKRPGFLKNPKTGRNLELDGYSKELNLAFEYDGEQHYFPVKRFGGEDRFQYQQQRDRLKDKLCKENNITLIRIPYWEKKNLNKYITNELKRRGIS